MEPIRVGWKVSALSNGMASVRYRALLPILFLGDHPVESRLMCSADDVVVDELDVLVMVKCFKAEDVTLVQRASAKGVRVVFDLCDNIFIDAYASEITGQRPLRMLEVMAPFLDAIVVTTESLRDVVQAHFPGIAVEVIPDGIETPETLSNGARLLLETAARERATLPRLFRRLMRFASSRFREEGVRGVPRLAFSATRRAYLFTNNLMKRAMARFVPRLSGNMKLPQEARGAKPPAPEGTHRIVWFGNHGAVHASFGMLDLLLIRDALEAVAREFEVELVVISNNYPKYAEHIEPLAIPSRYVEWSPAATEKWLENARVVVLPNSLDPFSVCKSPNRSVLATSMGIPVVATPTPALAPLLPYIHVGDTLEGLRRYLTDLDVGRKDAASAYRAATEAFGRLPLGQRWHGFFRQLLSNPPRQQAIDAQCVVVLHLIQDLDLALPILRAATAENLRVMAWCSAPLVAKSPRVLQQLRAVKIPVSILPHPPQLESTDWPESLKVLLTVAETNLGPHLFPRRLSELAADRGIEVVTLQHGFENVGLTYEDPVHRISTIDIVASKIYIWGPQSTLHPKISSSVRDRCVPMGCPKAVVAPLADLGDLLKNRQVVGVFENLHWHRYDDEYRTAFLRGVDHLAATFPDVLFLVKPHHAGLWLTERYEGARPMASNVLVVDPKDPLWENHTAPSLFGWMQAVLTTPSTVALDAARCGMPVAVVAGRLDLDNYAPLTLLRKPEDWTLFVQNALDLQSRRSIAGLSNAFVERVLVPGDAARRIAVDLAALTLT